MPVLVLLKADGSERVDQVFELTTQDNILGRAEGVHIPIIDPTVSRQHARIVLHEGRWWAMSLSADNPLRVAGQPVQQVALVPGTTFVAGRLTLRFEDEDPRRKSTVLVDGSFATGATMADPAVGAWQMPAPAARAPAPAVAPAHPPPTEPVPVPMAVETPVAPSVEIKAPTERPPSALQTRSKWPWLLAVLLIGGGGAAAYQFRDQLPGLAAPQEPLPAPNSAPTPEPAPAPAPTPAPDEPTPQAKPEPAEQPPPTPVSDCRALKGSPPSGGELARVKEINGEPGGFMYSRGPSGAPVQLSLEYPKLGQVVNFSDGVYKGGFEGKRDDSVPGPLAVDPWMIRPDTPPRCIVELLGPARVSLGAFPLPGWPADGPVPIAWTLEKGGLMVTSGDQLALLNHTPRPAAGDLPTEGAFVGESDGVLISAQYGGGGWTIRLDRIEPSKEEPTMTWFSKGLEEALVFESRPEDRIVIYEATGPGKETKDYRLELSAAQGQRPGELFTLIVDGPYGREIFKTKVRNAYWKEG